MKTSLYILLFSVLMGAMGVGSSYGKNYSVPNHNLTIVKTDSLATTALLSVVNLTSSDLDLKYTIINDGFAFSGWGYSFCDLNQCFTGKYASNNTNILGAKDTSAFNVTVNSFRGEAQSENMTIKIWDPSDPNNPDTVSITINATRLGIENLLIPGSFVMVYPNPCTDYLNLEISQNSFHPVKAVIYNTLGKAVSEQAILGETAKLSLYDLPRGIYFLNLSDRNGRQAIKQFVKE